MDLKFKTSTRGFGIIQFRDHYNVECSLQKSSLASEDAIWLGVDNPDPKILASVAGVVNPKTGEMSGYVPYHIPKDVSLTNRMHLTRDQVASLLPILEAFVETGELADPGDAQGKDPSTKIEYVDAASSATEDVPDPHVKICDLSSGDCFMAPDVGGEVYMATSWDGGPFPFRDCVNLETGDIDQFGRDGKVIRVAFKATVTKPAGVRGGRS